MYIDAAALGQEQPCSLSHLVVVFASAVLGGFPQHVYIASFDMWFGSSSLVEVVLVDFRCATHLRLRLQKNNCEHLAAAENTVAAAEEITANTVAAAK
ncbi:hypothetical protein EJB05_37176, partial [Eragrostis curvula]